MRAHPRKQQAEQRQNQKVRLEGWAADSPHRSAPLLHRSAPLLHRSARFGSVAEFQSIFSTAARTGSGIAFTYRPVISSFECRSCDWISRGLPCFWKCVAHVRRRAWYVISEMPASLASGFRDRFNSCQAGRSCRSRWETAALTGWRRPWHGRAVSPESLNPDIDFLLQAFADAHVGVAADSLRFADTPGAGLRFLDGFVNSKLTRFHVFWLIPRVCVGRDIEVPGVVSETATPDALLLVTPDKKPDYEQACADQDVDPRFRRQVFQNCDFGHDYCRDFD